MLKFISILQSLGIILVVAGHSLYMYPDGAHGERLLAMKLIYSFHMPLFLFISGFLMMLTAAGGKKYGIGTFALRKAQRLLVPYVVLTALTFAPRALMSGMAREAIPLTGRAFVEAFFLNSANPIPFMWFLQADFVLLVTCFAAVALLRKHIPAAWILCALAVVFIILPHIVDFSQPNVFSWHKVVRLGIYFVGGMAYAHWRTEVERFLRLGSPLSILVSAAIWLAAFFCRDIPMSENIAAFGGIAMCVSVALMMEKHRVCIFDTLTGATYMIYLLSWYVNIATQQVLGHYVQWPWWVHSLLSLTLGILLPLAIFRWMQRHRHLRPVRTIAAALGHRL